MPILRTAFWFLKGLREYTKGGYQSASKRFNPSDLEGIDISNRSYMITGANSGVGIAAALNIAKRGGTVHMVCRNKERGEAVQKELQEQSGNQNIHLHLVDLSRPEEVKTFTETFKSSGQPLHVLINNAAAIMLSGDKREVTEDGLETMFATNTLGVHMLTSGLLPVLEKAEDPRVIIVSSGAMLVHKLDVNDLQFEKMSKFDGNAAYAQTKRQEVVMASEYAKLYPKLQFSSTHPGWADTPGAKSALAGYYDKLKDRLRSPDEGADTMVWLAISPAATKFDNGLFFQDRQPVPTHLPLSWTRSSPEDERKLITKLDEFALQFRVEK